MMLPNGEHVDIGSLGGLADMSLPDSDHDASSGLMPLKGIGASRSRNLL